MRVPDEVRECVVFIGLPKAHGEHSQELDLRGTAFFVSIPSERFPGRLQHGYLVTARHSAEKIEGHQFYLRINRIGGRSVALPSGDHVRWWYHPDDPLIDVAILPWMPPQEEYDYKAIPASMFLTDEIIRSERIGTGDEVFLTGLFAHMSGRTRNLPIVRMGNIAMMPDEEVPTSLGPMDAYLIEARSLGGISGSPVFVASQKTVKPEQRGSYYFLGLMHGHWDLPPEAQAPGYSPVNMGIAIVVPAKRILEAINQPGLAQLRQTEDESFHRDDLPGMDHRSLGEAASESTTG